MTTLQNGVAVITGAARGLGAALAIALGDAGCRLVLCGRSLEALDETSRTVAQRTGAQPDLAVIDLADSASVAAAVAEIARRTPRVDVLINNAAMWLESSDSPYPDHAVLGVVNAAITGTFLLTQGLMPLLLQSSRPDVVTIGSVSALPNAALQTVSVPFYAAKHGQAALADGLRQRFLGTPIRSIVVHPPYLDDVRADQPEWEQSAFRSKGERATNRDVVEAVLFAVTRPRHVTLTISIDADQGGLFAAPPRS